MKLMLKHQARFPSKLKQALTRWLVPACFSMLVLLATGFNLRHLLLWAWLSTSTMLAAGPGMTGDEEGLEGVKRLIGDSDSFNVKITHDEKLTPAADGKPPLKSDSL